MKKEGNVLQRKAGKKDTKSHFRLDKTINIYCETEAAI